MLLLTDELKKILVALNDGDDKSALSPESLFQAIWKVNKGLVHPYSSDAWVNESI